MHLLHFFLVINNQISNQSINVYSNSLYHSLMLFSSFSQKILDHSMSIMVILYLLLESQIMSYQILYYSCSPKILVNNKTLELILYYLMNLQATKFPLHFKITYLHNLSVHLINQ